AEKRAYRDTLYQFQYPKSMVLNGEEKSVFGFEFENYDSPGAAKLFLNSIRDQDIIIKEVVRELGLGALKEHTILPQVIPVQIIRIGNIIIAGLPTEITTVAYNRLQQTLLEVFEKDGVDMVLISSYANEYAGYTTTSEEYMIQRYEGGHTLYGKYQLGAFQTVFEGLGKEMLKPVSQRDLDRTRRPPVFSQEELNLRTNLIPFEK
ncbi:MAG: neutral ceramidase, partial [Limisphaerales bacterium]